MAVFGGPVTLELPPAKKWVCGVQDGMCRFFTVLLLGVMLCGQVEASNRIDGDMSAIRSALKLFRVNAGRYPTEKEGLKALIEKPATYPENKRWQKIMDRMPLDPWGNPYQYVLIASSTKTDPRHRYDFDGMGLYSFGPDGMSSSRGNDPDDCNSWDEASLNRRSSFERWRDSSAAFDVVTTVAALGVGIGLLRVWQVRAKA